MDSMKKITVLGEPYVSMTDEQAQKMKPDEARQMLQTVKYPQLDEVRSSVRTMLTSELIGHVAHPGGLEKRLFATDAQDKLTVYDEQLIMAAAIMAIGDEIDRRIPRP
jgi:hypothetical protein